MNNQVTWTCGYCGRTDIQGSMCPSCGANRTQSANLATPYSPVIEVAPPVSVVPVSPWRIFSGVANGCILLFMIPFVCAGIFAIGVAFMEWSNLRVLGESGATTQATVIERESKSSSKTGTSYDVTYKFTASNEHDYSGSDSVSSSDYESAEPGSKITIRYAQSDPSISHIGDHESNDLAIFITIFSICWNGFLVLFFFFWLRGISRWRRASSR